MAGPPRDDPGALWFRLTERPRPSLEVELTRGGSTLGRCRLWVLSDREMREADADAEQSILRAIGAGPDTSGRIGLRAAAFGYRVLHAACRDAADPRKPVFPTADAVARALWADDAWTLLAAYDRLVRTSGPSVGGMTAAEMEAWIAALQAGGSRSPLSQALWGSAERVADVPGMGDGDTIDAHWLCWVAARRAMLKATG